MTSNVTLEGCRARIGRQPDLPVCQARLAQLGYSSSVCSKTWPAARPVPSAADVATRLTSAIDELAAAADRDGSGCLQFADRLARTWGMITAEDPELASRAARY